MKFPKWKLIRMVPKLVSGNPKAIAEFILLIMNYAASRSENAYTQSTVDAINALLDPDGDGKVEGVNEGR